MIQITSTHTPATDLGYLLHKNPNRVHEWELSFGRAVVAFPEASEERCTVALIVDLDPVGLVRSPGGSLSQYVNDRPYVASSFLCSALNHAFGTAMGGRCKERPELVDQELPFEVSIPVLSAPKGEEIIRRLFEPLGYEVEVVHHDLDTQFPEWGESPYFEVKLKGRMTTQALLHHLYVLIPVLDAKKHYFISPDEVQKLIRKGEGWLSNHPEKNMIVRSFLKRKESLIREALEQIANAEPELAVESESVDIAELIADEEVAKAPAKKSLHEQRHERVVEVIRSLKPSRVADLGCGDGKLIRKLIPVQGIKKILGMDVSYFELEKATRALRLDQAGPALRERLELIHGSLMYRDERLEGFDVATAIEVIEHLDLPRLRAFEEVVFGHARPRTLIVTTPNREYNAVYEDMEGLRHSDHRFEWTRAEFQEWAETIVARFPYHFVIEGLGEAHDDFGSPSLMAVFSHAN